MDFDSPNLLKHRVNAILENPMDILVEVLYGSVFISGLSKDPCLSKSEDLALVMVKLESCKGRSDGNDSSISTRWLGDEMLKSDI